MSRWRWALFAVAVPLLAGCGYGARPATSPAGSPSPATVCDRRSPLRIDARVRVGPGAGPMAVAGASLWTARPAAGVVVSVPLDETRAPRALHLGGALVSLAAGFGGIYVADRDNDRILRVDSRTRTVLHWADIQTPIKIARAGEKLFVVGLDDGALYELDPSAQGARPDIGIPASAPVDAAYEAPNLWVLGGADRGLSPFDVRLNAFARVGVRLPVRVVGTIAAGRGAVWVALPSAHSVLRLDQSTQTFSEVHASRGFRPTAIAVDDCAVWIGDAGGHDARIDAVSGRALGRPVRIGRALAALVADRGGVWASDPRDGTVVRVAPRR